ncbi:MAG: 2-dehydropantoate 2-reductase, partial [Betaproteobacteria bacterium]
RRLITGKRNFIAIAAQRPGEATAIPELLIVFTKAMHTNAALSGVRHLLGQETHVLSLQNGLGNIAALSSHVPLSRVLIGVTTVPADVVAPGHVHSHGAGGVRLMSADGVLRPFVGRVAAALNAAGLPTEVDPGVMTAVWEKVAFSAALNSVCAVTGCTVGQVAAMPAGLALAQAIAGDVDAVARATGIAANAGDVAAAVDGALDRHGSHKPSMLQDILAGRRTEIEAINGAVIAAAQKSGIRAPHTATLLALVRLVESRAPSTAA